MNKGNMEDIIVVNSDSDDEAVPQPSTSTSTSTSTLNPAIRRSKSPSLTTSSSDEADEEADSVEEVQTVSLLADRRRLSNDSDNQRKKRRKKRIPPFFTSFPKVKEVYTQLLAVIGVNYSQSRIMRVFSKYIVVVKGLQKELSMCPKKCKMFARNVSRTLLLFRALTEYIHDAPFYLQKLCELLALYTFFEIKYASVFRDSKIAIAERILSNISMHLEVVNNKTTSFALQIFTHIPNMGRENEIMQEVFRRLIPKPLIPMKCELNDRLYVQYLIAYYHWINTESLYEDQMRIINEANTFMKPQRTLKTSMLYTRHLPSYGKRNDATKYILMNMVYFDDLRKASISDGSAENVPDLIDLCDDMDGLSIDYSKIGDESDSVSNQSTSKIKLERRQIIATVDLTEIPDDAPWLTRLVRKAVELEVKLPRLLTAPVPNEVPIVEIVDSSDDEAWAFSADTNAMETETNSTVKVNNMSTNLPDDDNSSSDDDLKELLKVNKKRVISTRNAEESSKEAHNTFNGIAGKPNRSPVRTIEPSCSKVVPNVTEKEMRTSPIELFTDIENGPDVVGDILRDFSADVTTSQSDDSMHSDDAMDENAVPKKKVTLKLNTNLFDSSEDSWVVRTPKKTYLRKKSDSVDENEPVNNTMPTEKNKLPNVLFSGKVISLRDDNASGSSPSYLQVPESVEVSSKGSNVVFSMKGRRLSSFPPLEASSSNGVAMPDFDEVELFGDMEKAVMEKEAAKQKEKEIKKLTEETVSMAIPVVKLVRPIKTSLKSRDQQDSEKPAKRRNVRFADDVKGSGDDSRGTISPEQNSPSTSASTKPSTSTQFITSINKCNSPAQHLQQNNITNNSNSSESAQKVNVASKLLQSSSSTPSSAPTSSTSLSALPKPTSKDMTVIKQIQEQALVQDLFPDLFYNNSNEEERLGQRWLSTHGRKINTNSPQFNSSVHANNINRVCNNDSPTIHNLRKNSSSSRRNSISDFDKYLRRIKCKSKTDSTNISSSCSSTRGKRERSRRQSTSKVPVLVNENYKTLATVNVNTKSLVDITKDEKLTKMTAVVAINRLNDKNLQTMKYQVEETKDVTAIVPSIKLDMGKPRTESLEDFLAHVVEQQGVEKEMVEKEKVPLEKADEITPIPVAEKSLAVSLPIVSITLPAVCIEPVQPAHLEHPAPEPPDNEDKPTLESVIKSIKTEELEGDCSTGGMFKKPSRRPAKRRPAKRRPAKESPQYLKEFKTPPATPSQTEVEFVTTTLPTESLAERLEVANTLQEMRTSPDTATTPPTTNDIIGSAKDELPCTSEEANKMNNPPKQVKVRLKRIQYDYMVVSNTALDDDEECGHTSEALERVNGSATSESTSNERKRRVKGSAARKEQALKRIFERGKDAIAEGYRLFDHNIESISTPPPTPPSPSLSLELPARDKNIAVTHKPTEEQNNNQHPPEPRKRRKTMCAESHHFLASPDFLLDEDICAPAKPAADSPTVEVMRLHTGTRDGQPKPQTVATQNVTPETAGSVIAGDENASAVNSAPVQPNKQIETTTEAAEVDTARNTMVSRTYSKNNMVQHVFVPAEIEKYIEEQAKSSPNIESDTIPKKRKVTSNSGETSQAADRDYVTAAKKEKKNTPEDVATTSNPNASVKRGKKSKVANRKK